MYDIFELNSSVISISSVKAQYIIARNEPEVGRNTTCFRVLKVQPRRYMAAKIQSKVQIPIKWTYPDMSRIKFLTLAVANIMVILNPV